MPTVMLFVKSLGGVSHTKAEDTPDADLELSVRALYELTRRTLAWATEGADREIEHEPIADSHAVATRTSRRPGPSGARGGRTTSRRCGSGCRSSSRRTRWPSGLIAAGMTWWQGLLTVSLGNLIVLIPILLNSHPGTKYGIPFPVLVRSSFGIRGANVAAMARALVACGWFGIQTWIGALALDTLMTTLTSGWADVSGHKAIAFGVFWLVQVAIILRGIEGIKFLESYAAPLLLGGERRPADLGASAAAATCSRRRRSWSAGDQSFWALFGPGLAANVGYWITLSMNIPDFTRYAQRPAVADRRPEHRDADDDDRLLVHRHRGDVRDDRRVRRADLGSGDARRPAARRPAGPARRSRWSSS